MLHDHEGILLKHVGTQDQPRDFIESRMVVGGIGEDYVVFFRAGGDISEYVALYHVEIFVAELLLDAADE